MFSACRTREDVTPRKRTAIRSTLSEEDNVLAISELCDIAGVSRSGYYGWLRAEKYCKANPYRRLQRALRTSNTDDNLVNREFEQHGPRAVLLTDITYIPLNGAFCYLSTIIDGYTKQVLSYAVSQSLEVDFVLETVSKKSPAAAIYVPQRKLLGQRAAGEFLRAYER